MLAKPAASHKRDNSGPMLGLPPLWMAMAWYTSSHCCNAGVAGCQVMLLYAVSRTAKMPFGFNTRAISRKARSGSAKCCNASGHAPHQSLLRQTATRVRARGLKLQVVAGIHCLRCRNGFGRHIHCVDLPLRQHIDEIGADAARSRSPHRASACRPVNGATSKRRNWRRCGCGKNLKHCRHGRGLAFLHGRSCGWFGCRHGLRTSEALQRVADNACCAHMSGGMEISLSQAG